jgi:hypothetical protein
MAKEETMPWRAHQDLTATACLAAGNPHAGIRVLANGEGCYRLVGGRWGMLELIKVQKGFLVAAADPEPPCIDPEHVPPSIRRYLASSKLTPWRLLETHDCHAAIRDLAARPELDGLHWYPFVALPQPAAPLAGEDRFRASENLSGLLSGARPASPVPVLYGVDDIGKRTLLANAAGRAGLTVQGELPLRRVLYDGVFEYGIEKISKTIHIVEETLDAKDVLIISDGHLLTQMSATMRDEILLRELARLPCRVVLTSPRGPLQAANTLSLPCPGLETVEEAEEVIRAKYPPEALRFHEPALELLARGASAGTQGIVPGRLLYLIKLATPLLGGHRADHNVLEHEEAPHGGAQDSAENNEHQIVLSPDEIVMAISTVRPAWMEREGH